MVDVQDISPCHSLHRGGLAGRKATNSEATWHPALGTVDRLFTQLQWWLYVSHSPVAILAATADCLQLCFSQYWHLDFLFLNAALERVLGCGGPFTIIIYFCFAAVAWEHQAIKPSGVPQAHFPPKKCVDVSWPPPKAHVSP